MDEDHSLSLWSFAASPPDVLVAALPHRECALMFLGAVPPGTVAIAKSVMTGQEIFYGIIDGQDSKRLLDAYIAKFNSSLNT